MNEAITPVLPQIDPRHIGHQFLAFRADIELGRATAFAVALGAKDPIYLDKDAAIAAGHRSVPALPTFPITLTPFTLFYEMAAVLEVDPSRILHATQKFVFHETAYAGDTLVGEARIENLYDRKGGALLFIEKVTDFKRDGTVVCEDHCTLVVRNSVGRA